MNNISKHDILKLFQTDEITFLEMNRYVSLKIKSETKIKIQNEIWYDSDYDTSTEDLKVFSFLLFLSEPLTE